MVEYARIMYLVFIKCMINVVMQFDLYICKSYAEVDYKKRDQFEKESKIA